jgi:hypothetical protein
MPGLPALVTTAKRLPLGNGWRENPTAKQMLTLPAVADIAARVSLETLIAAGSR